MGLIDRAATVVFGAGNAALRDTIEVFRENAEGRAERDAEAGRAALAQFAAEFEGAKAGGFDRFMDGVNRIPRPAMALGTLGLFVAAMVDPVWFAARMAGLGAVPDPLWWLMGAIVSFYFGARFQVKGQQFRRALVDAANAGAGRAPADAAVAAPTDDNAALSDWRASHAR